MSDTTYRAGDIVLVDGKPAVWLMGKMALRAWSLDGSWSMPDHAEVGPALGNVADIAAKGGVGEVLHLAMATLTNALDVLHKASGLPEDVDDIDAMYERVLALGDEARREGRIGALREVEHNIPDVESIGIIRQMLAEEPPC